MKKFARAVLALSILGLPLSRAQAAEPEKTQLRIAVGSQILNYMPLELAVKLGHFKQEGLDVTVENFQAGGSKALQALIGGSVDGAVGFYDHTIQMQAQGKSISCVFLLNEVPGVLIGIRSDLSEKVKSIPDLKGMKLGITSPGSSTDTMARYFLKRFGLSPREVNIIAVGSGAPGMVALEVGNIDALVYFDPVATLMARKKTAKALFDARNAEGSRLAFGGEYPSACLYLNADFITRNPETVQRLASAMLRVHRWIDKASAEQLVDEMPRGYKTDDRELNIQIIKASSGLFSKTGMMTEVAAQVPLSVLADYDPKIDPKKIDISKTFTNRFVEEAARRLK
jgi:NitT/TauT family transport system substrate-binding protein